MAEWEVFAVKYADRNARKRAESFLSDPGHDQPHALDYFVWVLRCGTETILVDCGYDTNEAERRSQPIRSNAEAALAPLGLTAKDITKLIVTHLHFDHAGGLHLFPNAVIHLQAREMTYATGPCMCHDALRRPFTADHVCEAVRRVYAGGVVFHDGDGEVADGVTVHCIGGHSRGLQAVRVRTQAGFLCLASDAAHFYENFLLRKPFPVVVDVESMLNGYTRLETLASDRRLVVPGHDPLVRELFPLYTEDIARLDLGPLKALPF